MNISIQYELSVVIVNHNTPEYLEKCLTSLCLLNQDVNKEVLVVDNSSNTGNTKSITGKYPCVELILSDRNVGFAAANNIALRMSRGEFILILNPDTVLPPGCLRELLEFLKSNKSMGMISPKLVMSDGHLDWACRRRFPKPSDMVYRSIGLDRLFPKSKLFGRYPMSYLNPCIPTDVDCVSGAFMLVRGQAIEDVGLLDEGFFMYFEDLDWAYRFIQAGWRVYYYPLVEVLHHKRASTKQAEPAMIEEFYKSMFKGYLKHYGGNNPWIMKVLMKLMFTLRMAASLFRYSLYSFTVKLWRCRAIPHGMFRPALYRGLKRYFG